MEIKHLDIEKGIKVHDLIEMMSLTAFNARRLGIAAKLWKEMIDEKAFIFLTIAGAMIPSGMRRIVKRMVEKNFANALVLTGANVVHEIIESLGFSHKIGSPYVDDAELSGRGINRIYDVFIDVKAFECLENFLSEMFQSMHGDLSSCEILWKIGEKLKDSFLREAYEKRIPIFCPTLHDSVFGLHMMLYGKLFVLDYKKDVKMILDLCLKHEKTGIIIVGGGVPKNFALQSMLLGDGFDYALQITTDSPQFGGLSGATLEEAKSWCKLKKNAKAVTVYCDATIALPLLYAYLLG